MLLPQSQYESAKKQLNAYEDTATKNWVGFSVVKVLAGHHLSDETAKTAVKEGFKVLQREGTEFNQIGFRNDHAYWRRFLSVSLDVDPQRSIAARPLGQRG